MEAKQMSNNGHPKIEVRKAAIEYAKFLITLSTGSIVLLVSFLDKLTKNPDWVFLAGVSLVAFMLSVISGIVLYTVLLTEFLSEEWNEKAAITMTLSIIAVWLFFLVAVVSLTVFAVTNLI